MKLLVAVMSYLIVNQLASIASGKRFCIEVEEEETCTSKPSNGETSTTTTTVAPTTSPGETSTTTTTVAPTTSPGETSTTTTTVAPTTSPGETSTTTTTVAPTTSPGETSTTTTTVAPTTSPGKHSSGKEFVGKLSGILNGTDNGILAVATFGSQLFVSRGEENYVDVYNTSVSPPNKTGDVHLSTGLDHGQLSGLAVNTADKLLYVSDAVNLDDDDSISYYVYKVNLTAAPLKSGDYYLVSSGHPNALSMNQAGGLVVATNRGSIEKLSNGSFSQVASCGSSNVYQAVELDNGRFVVSGCPSVNDVSLLFANGTTRRAPTVTASRHEHLSTPYSLVVDSKNYTIIADYGHGRIVVVNPEFSEARELNLQLNGKGPITKPLGLWFDEANHRLYVGEFGGLMRVLIFDHVHPSAAFKH